MFKLVALLSLLIWTTFALGAKSALLVSLGMPDAVLKAYLAQAKQYGIPVVIRGLYSDALNKEGVGSFKDTANRIQSLIKKSNLGGVSINPLLFRAFNIKVVPAYVVYDQSSSCIRDSARKKGVLCQDSRFDVVYGNVVLSQLIMTVRDRSPSVERAAYAKALLKRLSVGGVE